MRVLLELAKDRGHGNSRCFGHRLTNRKSSAIWPIRTGWDGEKGLKDTGAEASLFSLKPEELFHKE